jgi:hypothetical protein
MPIGVQYIISNNQQKTTHSPPCLMSTFVLGLALIKGVELTRLIV